MMWRGKSTRPSCQERYGKIVQHHWFGEGYLLIGFETGWVVVLSTHNREISEELHSEKMFTHGALEKMAYCSEISRAAVSCGSTVKLVDVAGGQFNELQGDKLEVGLDQTIVLATSFTLHNPASPELNVLATSSTQCKPCFYRVTHARQRY